MQNRSIKYTDEFVTRYKELSYGQRILVDGSVEKISSLEDPTLIGHHLERASYFSNWSHRVRSNLLVVYSVSKRTLTFLSCGSHSQAYRPTLT